MIPATRPARRGGRRHRAQMLLLVLAGFLLMAAVLVFHWMTFSSLETILAGSFEENALVRARALRSLVASMPREERRDVSFLATRYRDAIGFSEVEWMRPDAAVSDARLPEASRRKLMQGLDVTVPDERRSAVACYLPLDSRADPAVLRVTFASESQAGLFRILRRLNWFEGGVLATLMGILLLLLSWYGTPFSRMLDMAGAPASEDGAAGPMGNNERAYLVATFETALGGLRQRADELQQLSDHLVGGVSSGVVTLDTEGKIVRANAAARALLRATALAPDGANWEERRFDEVFPPALRVLAEQALASRRPGRESAVKFSAMGGEERTAAASLFPMTDSQGAFSGVLCLLTDLTRLHELEETLRAKENMAHLGEMTAGIAHEFRNTLASIAGFAQLMTRASPQEAEKILGYARDILEETVAARRFTDDFLRFARPLAPARETVAAWTLAEEAIREGRFSEGRILLEGDREAAVEADAGLLKQAILNLARNAVEATSEGAGADKPVRVRVSSDGESVRVAVSDEGPGMDDETRRKAFLPFFTTKAQGSGLGLALVRKIALAHDGEARIESAPGRGATVEITLPRAGARGSA